MKKTVKTLGALLIVLAITALLSSAATAADNLTTGKTEYSAGNFEEAISALENARAENPSSAEAAFYLGLAYKGAENLISAKKHLADAVTLDPNFKEARFKLAEIHYATSDYDAALTELEASEKAGGKVSDIAMLRGLVLMKKGDSKGAVENFEKAKELDKKLTQQANFWIGSVYMKDKDGDKAKTFFSEAVTSDPSSDIAAYAKDYMTALEKQKIAAKKLFFNLGFRYEFDSNVMLKPSDTSLATFISDQNGHRRSVQFDAEYILKGSGRLSLRTKYTYFANRHEEQFHNYNMASHSFTLMPTYYASKTQFLNLPLTYTYYELTGDKYLTALSFAPSWNVATSPNSLLTTYFKIRKKEYAMEAAFPDEDRDSTGYAIGLSYSRLFASKAGLFSIGADLMTLEDTAGDNWDNTGARAYASAGYKINGSNKLQAYAEADLKSFDNKNTFFRKHRRDETYTASAIYSTEFLTNTWFVLQYTRVRGKSTIDVYDYKKYVYTGGVDYKF